MELVLPGARPIAHAAVFGFESDGTDDLIIDTTELTFACPLDLTGIVSIAHWAAANGIRVTLKVPRDPDVASYLHRMDVLLRMPSRTRVVGRIRPGQKADLRKSLLEVTPLDAKNANELSERLGPLVRDFYARYTAPGAAAVFGACGELLSNAVDHGRSESGAFIAAQTFSGVTTEGPRFEFAVCDSGLGVMKRLRENRRHAHLTRDEVAISAAMDAGVSGVDDVGRGNGLSDVVEQTRLHGKIDFRMRSGRGQVGVAGSPTVDSTRTRSDRPDQTSGTWAWLSHWILVKG